MKLASGGNHHRSVRSVRAVICARPADASVVDDTSGSLVSVRYDAVRSRPRRRDVWISPEPTTDAPRCAYRAVTLRSHRDAIHAAKGQFPSGTLECPAWA